jgi:hypothetical protein
MKKCAYCGRGNSDDTAFCQECGTAVANEKQSAKSSAVRLLLKPFPPRVKWGLYSAAWGAVILATLCRNPADLLAAPNFPIGLLEILMGEKAIIAASFGGLAALCGGWMIYLVVTLATSYAKRVWTFSPVYIVFCLLLALNVRGCNHMLETASQIH